ncbi:hypothetical protein HD806DRAFT_491361 [Xylariaceae sp. AK1471]|nr:hypothetical protein HD806DRAFT_491361 [Xylariaceae sp. AK1471]
MLLYLLERDPVGGQNTIKVGGAHWRLAAHDLDTSEGLSFTCVSYVWGKEKEKSPFDDSFMMSDRTMPALSTVIAHRPSCTRIWVDALCVPVAQPERTLTLQSMGYIYSQAKEVVVVLSKTTSSVLEQMSVSDRLTSDHLNILGDDDWVSRAWTYQEVVNSRGFSITCEGLNNAIVDGSHFLNCVGFTLSRNEAASYEIDKRQRERLNTFEDLIADYMVAGYQERSALQVMSNMDRREQHFPDDHFYAMMGAISTVCSSFSNTVDPCEAFMSMCEQKGDYSFIYSTTQRDTSPTRRWRPASCGDFLPAVLAWHCYGEGQPAHEDSGSLYLDQVVVLEHQPLGDSGKAYLEGWRKSSKMPSLETLQIDVALSAALESMGFTGSPVGISTTHGFFFPSKRLWAYEGISILVATKVQWAFGAPGLVCSRGDVDTYIPGVFFGRVDNADATSVKIS